MPTWTYLWRWFCLTEQWLWPHQNICLCLDHTSDWAMPMKDKFLKEKKVILWNKFFYVFLQLHFQHLNCFLGRNLKVIWQKKSLWRKVNRFFVLFVLKMIFGYFSMGHWKSTLRKWEILQSSSKVRKFESSKTIGFELSFDLHLIVFIVINSKVKTTVTNARLTTLHL